MAKRSTVICLTGALLASLAGPAHAYQRPGATTRPIEKPDGTGFNGYSWLPAITPDGRFVAFACTAPDIVPGDTNGNVEDVFVYEVATRKIDLISQATDGTRGDAKSSAPVISADGRFVAFESDARSLVPDDTTAYRDIYLRDRLLDTTRRISVRPDGGQADGLSYQAAISADGRFVSFTSEATNLVPGDTNARPDIFVHDTATDALERVSVASDGSQGDNTSWWSGLSSDGRYVSFQSTASNFSPADTNGGGRGIFVRDRQLGVTRYASIGFDGSGGGSSSSYPVISADGRYVAWDSYSSNFVPGDTNGTNDVFVRDLVTGITERVTVSSAGVEGNGSRPAISPDGRFVGFVSTSNALVPGDTNGQQDTFIRDRLTKTTEIASLRYNGMLATGQSSLASISSGGRYVAFQSNAKLMPQDTGVTMEVHIRDRGPTLGIGALQAVEKDGQVTASGSATFSGAVLAHVSESSIDGGDNARDLGAELAGAAVTQRVESEDLLFESDPVALPKVYGSASGVTVGGAGGAGLPGIVYGFGFTLAGVPYEVRGSRTSLSDGGIGPSFGLYRCDTEPCAKVAPLSGSIGMAGMEVLAAVPLSVLGITGSAELTGVIAYASLGDQAADGLNTFDSVAVPSVTVLVPKVKLGAAPPGEPVSFTTMASLLAGSFGGTVTADLGDEVWAEACLGSVCGPAERAS